MEVIRLFLITCHLIQNRGRPLFDDAHESSWSAMETSLASENWEMNVGVNSSGRVGEDYESACNTVKEFLRLASRRIARSRAADEALAERLGCTDVGVAPYIACGWLCVQNLAVETDDAQRVNRVRVNNSASVEVQQCPTLRAIVEEIDLTSVS
jgi:hypothetical protein